MSNSIIFKRLFEIRVFHDYYLITGDGTSFYDRNQSDKENILSKKLLNRSYDVSNILSIEPDTVTKENLRRNKLVFAKTALGFIVGIEVIPENLSGEVRYKPRFELNTDLHVSFNIRPVVTLFNSITNIGLKSILPSIYYFTNKGKTEFVNATQTPHTSYPLSNTILQFQQGRNYEMGALANFGGITKEALQNTNSNQADHWEDTDDKRFVNQADKILLPHVFKYQIQEPQNDTQLEFQLLDSGNSTVKTLQKTITTTTRDVVLDFEKETNNSTAALIPNGFYTLKITGDSGLELIYPLYLNSSLYDRNQLGVIDIRLDEQNSPFSLLDTNGFLKAKINANGDKVSHPVFELRFTNRKTYWRYNKEVAFNASEITATSAFLQHNGKRLTSIKPKGLTSTLVPFKNGNSLLLPPPQQTAIKVEQEKIYSDIFINPSNRLLNSS
ncbi:hypothetical protein [Aquimarina algicola]|uniref:Uncharacterized protein n=1 Tax=Aquimarina algicola TaxID=2589995 RepID=A0A504IZJ5_9FLAO|nr:hypothetical protein [Aquimarina algicola]TPN83957.1 hypothetical protein FHK87_18505 [Aquimarina algicola]